VDLFALPDKVIAVVRQSVVVGVALARQATSGELLAAVRGAFVRGMDAGLLTCGAVAAVGVVVAVFCYRIGRTASCRPDRAVGTARDAELPISATRQPDQG
jgi:hypothetical protein